ncbi:unnamed protein product [Acanthoscelides obtectus]|uniref:PDEase domain-containing protein n=1 Tax=Acanthoscelides obtectus TaxID=200917 RepID=A0A9P0KNZ1_ACAOB|nr:unnamed protein product [Acanthoscelides obtectus]CAK1655852.1 hypothetical protein AOBTE_LOCUS19390 [Acanthoscelides obtectus]
MNVFDRVSLDQRFALSSLILLYSQLVSLLLALILYTSIELYFDNRK